MAQKVRDWKALTAAHKHRGEMLTGVFDPAGAAFTRPTYAQKTGTPRTYRDSLIEALLTVKLMTGLSLRAVEGFALGMRELSAGAWPVPNYSTLSRREAGLDVDLCTRTKPGEKRVLMVDSTGLKVFGEGEWKVRNTAESARFKRTVLEAPQLTQAKLLGRKGWRMASGCSKRSYVESMMHRLKSITGASLAARTVDRQKVEVRLRCKALNATSTSTRSPTV